MTNAERIAACQPTNEDWADINAAFIRIKMETVTALFIAIQNTIAEQAHPELCDSIDKCRDEILESLQNLIDTP